MQAAREMESAWGLELVSAWIILTVMFVFHQHGKYREARALALGASTDARHARERVEELEALTTFGKTLARARTLEQAREVLWRHLPLVLDGEEAWVLARAGTRWDLLLDTSLDPGPLRLAALEEAAERACREEERPSATDDPCQRVVLPLVAAEQLVGVVGVEFSKPENADRLRRRVPAIAALLAVALRTAQLFREIRENSLRDELTGCVTRAHGIELAEIEISRARRHGHATTILLFDIDNFKTINDEHGHLAGDAVLGAVGARVRGSLRRSDIVCRYGGDEFFALLPETPAAAAVSVGEWIREQVRALRIPAADVMLSVTASVGTATIPPGPLTGTDALTLQGLIQRADEALYEAKRGGRDRVAACTNSQPVAVPAA